MSVYLSKGVFARPSTPILSYNTLNTNLHFPHTPQSSGDDAAKTSRLALLLSRSLEDADDPMLMDFAAHTLGRLVRCSGAMTSDIVEREVGVFPLACLCWSGRLSVG